MYVIDGEDEELDHEYEESRLAACSVNVVNILDIIHEEGQ